MLETMMLLLCLDMDVIVCLNVGVLNVPHII
jgi:hypothetical protein